MISKVQKFSLSNLLLLAVSSNIQLLCIQYPTFCLTELIIFNMMVSILLFILHKGYYKTFWLSPFLLPTIIFIMQNIV